MPYKDPEKRKANRRAYYEAHREEAKSKSRAYYEKHRGESKRDRRPYYAKHREEVNSSSRARYQSLKLETFHHYGGNKGIQCVCCGESELTFLSLDHIGGGGGKHRRSLSQSGIGGTFYQYLKRNGFPPGYRLLCMNCNWAMKQGGTCPHGNLPEPLPEQLWVATNGYHSQQLTLLHGDEND